MRGTHRRVVETAIFGMGDQSHPETARWTCPHGRHVGQGCVPCYRAATAPDPALPLWAAVVWFTSPRPIPIKVLHDVHRHGRHFALDQPSTPWSSSSPGRRARLRAWRRWRAWSASSCRAAAPSTTSP
ncbi:hypothetical protein ACFQ0B_14615 [Nonomuraea thailandensis]